MERFDKQRLLKAKYLSLPKLKEVRNEKRLKRKREEDEIQKDVDHLEDGRLSFREIGQRVERKQATVMRIRHRWMVEETTDRWGQSHRFCWHIVRVAVMDRSTTSQQIQSVTYFSVSPRTIRRHLPHSAL
ncbi:hypothetical protein TNCV_1671321 [Trichonephila clavipes]|nr:hypothetical protein TNCV_1671321 [Trichonephila clavipes]